MGYRGDFGIVPTHENGSKPFDARRFGVTPQNLNNRLKVDRFTTGDLEKLAELIGGKFEYGIRFPDGTII